VLKVVAWGGWVLQIFCGLFLVTIQNNGENTSCSNGKNPWRVSGCDKLYLKKLIHLMKKVNKKIIKGKERL
jgi:hypothetical protein